MSYSCRCVILSKYSGEHISCLPSSITKISTNSVVLIKICIACKNSNARFPQQTRCDTSDNVGLDIKIAITIYLLTNSYNTSKMKY